MAPQKLLRYSFVLIYARQIFTQGNVITARELNDVSAVDFAGH